MSQLRHRFATTLATLSLSAAVALASANAVAQQPEHAHSADHSAGYGQQAAATNPAAQRKAAVDSTEAFINAHKQWAQARGASNKAVALQSLIAKAEARREMLAELIRTNPAEALRVAIPDEKQVGMPAEVLEMLEQRFEVEGELVVQYADFEDGTNELRHYLKTPFGEHFRLHIAGKNKDLKTGETVQIDGLLLESIDDETDGSIALQGDDSGILRLALGGSGTDGEPGPLANTIGEQRTLVMLINFLDDRSEPFTPENKADTLNGEVSDFMLENSYGQTWMNADVTNWMTIPKNKADGCPNLGYEFLADEVANNAGYDLTKYTRLIYIWPRNANCPFNGSGTVGGNPSRSGINGLASWDVISHELGHNFGLGHSHNLVCDKTTLGDNCTIKKYGDFPDIMGSGIHGHFNAFQKDRLGWLGHGASPAITTVTADGTYDISPLAAQDNKPKALKVLKSIDSVSGEKTWYYLHLRQPQGFDSGLGDFTSSTNYINGVSVHSGSKPDNYSSNFLDMTPGSSGGFWDAALETGFSYNDADAGVSFSTDWVDANSAQVSVDLKGSQTSCVRANPSINLTPGQSEWVEAGTTVSYSVTLTNRDNSVCGNTSYNLSAGKPSGWSAGFGSGTLTLAPGQSTTTTLTVTSASTATDGFYTITANAASGSYSTSGNVTYVVDNPVSNSAPTANSDSATTDSGVAVAIPVLNNDSDPDGDNLSVTSVSGVNGTAKINSNGTVTFTSASGFSGTEVFNYSISDGNGGSASASVSVTVKAVASNSAPVAGNDSATTDEGVAVTIPVLNNDSDPDGDSLTITSFSGVNGSVVKNNDGTITFTPASGFSGTETFSYVVSDGNGGTDSANVSVTVNAVASNSAPVAGNDSATTDEGVAVTIALLNNDSDPDGDNLTITSFSGVNGSVENNNDGTITFTPASGFSGTETFSYVVSDGNGGTDSATVTVTVNAIPVDTNSAPIAVDDSATMPTVTTIDIAVLENDEDPEGDALKVMSVTKAAKGTVVINTDGTIKYIPGNRFKNADSFSYTITDGKKTATATVNVQLQKSTGGSNGKGNGKKN